MICLKMSRPNLSAQNNLDLLVDHIAGQKMSWSILNGYTQALILSQLVANTEGKYYIGQKSYKNVNKFISKVNPFWDVYRYTRTNQWNFPVLTYLHFLQLFTSNNIRKGKLQKWEMCVHFKKSLFLRSSKIYALT